MKKILSDTVKNEFVEITGYHRKHVIRLLKEQNYTDKMIQLNRGNRIYTEAVEKALILIWEATDRICSKRLKAALPIYIESLEFHNHLKIDLDVKKLLLKISASTIDRLLSNARKLTKSKKRKSSPKRFTKKIKVKTFTEWKDTQIGHMEIDFVVHCGNSMSGKYVHTLVSTDVCTGWTEFISVLAKSQSLIVESINSLRKQLPFTLKGINSDNDSSFINESLFNYLHQNPKYCIIFRIRFLYMTEVELLKSIKSNDKKSFTIFYNTYKKKVYNIAFKMTGKSHDSEDITQ